MRIVRRHPVFSDRRGMITDILDGPVVDAVTLLTTTAGSIRGNHYHRQTTQYSYVVDGRFRLYTQRPGQPRRTRILRKGDLAIIPAGERHAFEALEPSTMIACAHGPRAGRGYEQDTVRLRTPLAGGPR